MKKQIIGWIIVASTLIWGILRWIDIVEPNFVINFLQLVASALEFTLLKTQMKKQMNLNQIINNQRLNKSFV